LRRTGPTPGAPRATRTTGSTSWSGPAMTGSSTCPSRRTGTTKSAGPVMS
jgi:hypothetical protein